MQENHNTLCVGIDLGTTNSVIATCSVENGRINTPVNRIDRCVDIGNRDIRRIESGELLPSCVYYQDMKGGRYEPIVGDYAKKMSFTQPYAVSRSIKKQMGKPSVSIPGWKKEYPDQTPEAVASRIIRHLIESLEDYYGEKIRDVIITIPASFNSAQSEATLRAAKLAGIDTALEGGEILLPEPEAVIYNVLNQIQNGTIHSAIDFSSQKNVMVFDIGGGTLDITLHKIRRNPENPNNFDFKPLATNRFSVIAGDVFDEAIAQLLYEKYIAYYERQSADIAKRIKDDYEAVIINLINYAEELKLKINNKYKDRIKRGNALTNEDEFESGGYMPNGYTFEDSVTLREFETCLSPLLGWDYKYADYKRFDKIRDDQNIIYPILDVLYKAAEKTNDKAIQVDAVIMNGGMSRLYLIEKRLTDFFGYKPITVIDPDKSVAQGAAVYHYFIHQDSTIKAANTAYMHKDADNAGEQRPSEEPAKSDTSSGFKDMTPPKQTVAIRAESAGVLNESIYLGLKGGSERLLAQSGQDIPFTSDIITGFSIAPEQTVIRIPIKQKTKGDTQQTIAVGNIFFKKAMHVETPVSIRFHLRRGNILDIEAWTSVDISGRDVIEKGTVTLSMGDTTKPQRSKRLGKTMLPPTGTKLVVANELSAFKAQIERIKRAKDKRMKQQIINTLAQKKKALISCGNPEAFAEGIIDLLRSDNDVVMSMNLLPVARKLSVYWDERTLIALSGLCLSVLSMELRGWDANSIGVTANIEAIQTIGACGIVADCEKLTTLCGNTKYRSALLYAFSRCGINHQWIYQQFLHDINSYKQPQDSLQAIGLLIYKNKNGIPDIDIEAVAQDVTDLIDSGSLYKNELSIALVTLGMILSCGGVQDTGKVRWVIDNIETVYGEDAFFYTQKARSFVEKMMGYELLTDEDEAFLLGVLMEADA